MSVRLVLCLGASLVAFAAPQAVAEDFYAGKSISVLVGAGAGGSYDVYARTLATHMQRHIPGQPSIIVKIAGGVGGGVATAVQMEHSVPKDGLTLGIVQQTNVTSQITEDEVKGRYDVTKWHWIGNMAPLRNMLGVWHTAPAQSLDDARRIETIIGATGRNSPTYTVPAALNQLIGTKYKIVLGYNGTADLNLAMERGEIQGRGANWISVVISAPQYIAEKKFKVLVVDGLTRDPTLPDVPTLLELAQGENEKAAVRLISASGQFARAFFFPPNTPSERVAILRKAFDVTMKDAAFLQEAEKLKMEIEPTDGATLDRLAREIINSPPQAISLAKELIGSK